VSAASALIVGASGPTGIHLARLLAEEGVRVRVASRSEEGLARRFPGERFERVRADALREDDLLRTVEGCSLVFDCIGTPMETIADHPRTARNVAAAVRAAGARCVHVSSYWAYLPIRRNPVDEDHPREGGPLAVRMRREAEDVLLEAGAAVVNLPDFYGPDVYTSILQQALEEAAAGRKVHWIGSADTVREHVFVPDAMRIVARLARRDEAYGRRWIVPGAGPISPRRALEIAGEHLGRKVELRAAGALALRIFSLLSPPLRGFMPMVPHYLRPAWFDGRRLHGLLGELPATPYERGIALTLDAIAASR